MTESGLTLDFCAGSRRWTSPISSRSRTRRQVIALLEPMRVARKRRPSRSITSVTSRPASIKVSGSSVGAAPGTIHFHDDLALIDLDPLRTPGARHDDAAFPGLQIDGSGGVIEQRLGRRPTDGPPRRSRLTSGCRIATDLVGQPDGLVIIRVGTLRLQAQQAEASLAGEERQDDRRVVRLEAAVELGPLDRDRTTGAGPGVA